MADALGRPEEPRAAADALGRLAGRRAADGPAWAPRVGETAADRRPMVPGAGGRPAALAPVADPVPAVSGVARPVARRAVGVPVPPPAEARSAAGHAAEWSAPAPAAGHAAEWSAPARAADHGAARQAASAYPEGERPTV